MAARSSLMRQKYRCIPQLLNVPGSKPICQAYDEKTFTGDISNLGVLYDTREDCDKQCISKQTTRDLLKTTLKYLDNPTFSALRMTSKQAQQDEKLAEIKRERREQAMEQISMLQAEDRIDKLAGIPEWRQYSFYINPYLSDEKWLEILKDPNWPIDKDQLRIRLDILKMTKSAALANNLMSGHIRHFDDWSLHDTIDFLSDYYYSSSDRNLESLVRSMLNSGTISVTKLLSNFRFYLNINQVMGFNTNFATALLTAILNVVSKKERNGNVYFNPKESKGAVRDQSGLDFINDYGLTNVPRMSREELIIFIRLIGPTKISEELGKTIIARLLELKDYDTIIKIMPNSNMIPSFQNLERKQKNTILANALLPESKVEASVDVDVGIDIDVLPFILNSDDSNYLFQMYFGLLNEYRKLPSASKQWLKNQVDRGLITFNKYVNDWIPSLRYNISQPFLDYLENEYVLPDWKYRRIYDILVGQTKRRSQ